MCFPEGKSFLPKVSFLGHMVDISGIHTQTDKIEAIRNFPQPRSVENVCSFLLLCGYYCPFISGFAKIASPLNQLTKKGVLFHWDAPQQNSLDALKTALQHLCFSSEVTLNLLPCLRTRLHWDWERCLCSLISMENYTLTRVGN